MINEQIIINPAPVAPSFNAGYSGTMGYWRSATGEVRMRGTVVGNSGGLAFTLPAGFRPAATRIFITASASFANFGTVTVYTTGQVYVAGSYADPITCYMEAVSFPAEG